MLSLGNPHLRGSTLIESAIAAAVCALFLGSLFTVNTSTMESIKMAREVACASQVLQQRIEAMRIANDYDTGKRDFVVMTVQIMKGPDAGYEDISHDQLFTRYEQLLFSRVTAVIGARMTGDATSTGPILMGFSICIGRRAFTGGS